MGNTRRVVSGDDATADRLRSATPPSTGPLAGTGATPDPATTSTKPERPTTEVAPLHVPTADATVTVGRTRRRRIPFVHAVHRPPSPRRVAAATARAVRDWSRRPSGRLTLPGLLLLALVSVTGAAGALLVPATARAPQPNAHATADPDLGSGATPSVPATPDYTLGPTTLPDGPGVALGRPSDVLAGWAQQIGLRVDVPAGAMQAYGYAEWVVSQTTPGCKLSWTTLAAIGKVESNHGRSGGAILGPDGQSRPPIVGLPLDGQDDRKRILDTDRGVLDGDAHYDRAVGPMQFIPTTWQESGVDADNDGVKNAHDIDDAALAAANYLCKGGRDLSTARDWWNAILSYNNVQPYAQRVFDAANDYGTGSRI